MDQKAADELTRGQPHGLHPVSLFDPIVFPVEGDGASLGAEPTVV